MNRSDEGLKSDLGLFWGVDESVSSSMVDHGYPM